MNTRLLLLVSCVAAVTLNAADPKGPAKAAPKKQAKVQLPPNPKKLAPPPGIAVPTDVRKELFEGVDALGREIAALEVVLRSKPALHDLLPDVQIFHNAVNYALRDDIFYSEKQFDSARNFLKLGMERAQQLRGGAAPWASATGLMVRGYVSKIDGSVQPYGLVVPPGFKPGGKPMRLDFWLHGRGDTLNEIAFLEGRLKSAGEFSPDDTFVLHPYGRFMNAFKFAGEVDVFEALAHAKKHYAIDADRVSMRGFSMGGAGTWHLGAHHADQWAAVNPGAGFVDVLNYQKLGDKLDTIPWYEQKLWNLYDPLACPVNLVNSTLVAYSGETDSQKAAADLMEAALKKEGIKMTHIIGPDTGHKYEPGAKRTVAGLVDAAATRGVNRAPEKVTFVTYSLKWNQMHWVTLEGLVKHWGRASIEAEIGERNVIRVKTANVSRFTIDPPASLVSPSLPTQVMIDGQRVGGSIKGAMRRTYALIRGQWTSVTTPDTSPAKRHNLQGPIDDAFMDSFLFVKPTGRPLNAAVGGWVDAEMKDAMFQWHRFFRGAARSKDDKDISEADIKNNNLILWGDPRSNTVLARIADKLPITWTEESITVGKDTFDAAKNAPVMIYPNPLNPERYVVLNSGFTFPQFGTASNSQQTPKLPDWAVLDLGVPVAGRVLGNGVTAAGFFGEKWEVTGK